MKTAAIAFLYSVIAAARFARADSAWTLVPASLGTRSLETVAVADAPTEDAVVVVGVGLKDSAPPSDPLNVVAIDIPTASRASEGKTTAIESSARALPEGAHWPDADGRIGAVQAANEDAPQALDIRNPWEVRVHGAFIGTDTVFLCGGIVAGGAGGPIAILNGHIVKQGDTLNRYRVGQVMADGVLLEKNGSYFVIPRGRRTTIAAVDG
jgi:hypothetical protein